ncbi:MAG: AMP-binding protein [Candidatus Methanomethylophilaceae archaeon]|nr:AMP-binding protein [Candidatus Methanomethylophilaceae archaeon]
MRNINQRYVEETYDEEGLLKTIRFHWPENFNFGYDIVDDIAEHDPDLRAVVWASDTGEERTFTFGDLKRLSDKTANYLMSLGIKKGDRVMIMMKQRYEFWYLSVALHKIGAIMIQATYMLTKHDVEYRINAAEVETVICTSQTQITDSVDAAENIPSLKRKIIVGAPKEGWLSFAEGVDEASDELERIRTKADDIMLIYFTSGTAGNPKMVMHDYTYPLGHIQTAKHWQNVIPGGLHFTVSDTGWAKSAWGKIYGQWIMECAVMVYEYDKFDPSDILRIVEKHKVTSLCSPPTMFRMYINAGLEGHDLSSLKSCTIAGEALNPDVFKTWHKSTGIMLMEGFGQTETTVLIANLRGMTPKPGSMGRPTPQYVADIVDENGKPCAPGVNGEIVVGIEPRPPGMMIGYYRDPEKTAKTHYGGYHHTGDIAWKDEDGYFWYIGRNDDVIKSSGYRISPFEVESVLVEHPSVLECAITGVPDPVRGQVVKATIVLKKGYEPDEELKKEIQKFVKKSTAPYKYPRIVEFVPELPKSISGKIRRHVIRDKDASDSA